MRADRRPAFTPRRWIWFGWGCYVVLPRVAIFCLNPLVHDRLGYDVSILTQVFEPSIRSVEKK